MLLFDDCNIMILENWIDEDKEEVVITDCAARRDSNNWFKGDDSTCWDFQKFIQELEVLVKSTQVDDRDGLNDMEFHKK